MHKIAEFKIGAHLIHYFKIRIICDMTLTSLFFQPKEISNKKK